MILATTLLKKCLSVNNSVIDNIRISEDESGITSI